MFRSNAPSRREGNNKPVIPASSSPVMLLVCLDHILLNTGSSSVGENTNQAALPEELYAKRSWKPGKVTEIMNNFKNGTLRSVREEAKPTVRGKPRHESAGEPQDELQNSFEEQVGRRADHTLETIPLRDPPETNSTVPSIKWTSQGLFTTHSTRSSKSILCTTSMPVSPPDLRRFNNPFQLPAVLQPQKSFHSTDGTQMNNQLRRENTSATSIVTDDCELSDGLQNQRKFKTAFEQLILDDNVRGIKRYLPPPSTLPPGSGPRRKIAKMETNSTSINGEGLTENPDVNALMADERLKNIEPKMVEAVLNEVIELGASTDWDDIAGLESVKNIIREIIIWPMQRPDIFTGLRGPPKGILLFGPPGTGKSTYREGVMEDGISPHTPLWIDGCGAKSEDKLLVIGVTNRPQELDDAARRRLVKRIYIPLPDAKGRQQLIRNLLKDQHAFLAEEDYKEIASLSGGYSGADMASLCKEAAYGPIRDIGHDIQNIEADKVRPIRLEDFEQALKQVKPSVASSDLSEYEVWDRTFGCHT